MQESTGRGGETGEHTSRLRGGLASVPAMGRRILALAAILLVTGCGPRADDATLITQFTKDLTASSACSGGGYRACQAQRLAHAYPGAVDQDVARACIAAATEDPKYRYTVSVVPGSLTPTPEWVGPAADGAADWTFGGKRPEGTTYAVDLAVSDTYLGEDHTVVWTSHVTVLDGVVYWFPAIC